MFGFVTGGLALRRVRAGCATWPTRRQGRLAQQHRHRRGGCILALAGRAKWEVVRSVSGERQQSELHDEDSLSRRRKR